MAQSISHFSLIKAYWVKNEFVRKELLEIDGVEDDGGECELLA